MRTWISTIKNIKLLKFISKCIVVVIMRLDHELAIVLNKESYVQTDLCDQGLTSETRPNQTNLIFEKDNEINSHQVVFIVVVVVMDNWILTVLYGIMLNYQTHATEKLIANKKFVDGMMVQLIRHLMPNWVQFLEST